MPVNYRSILLMLLVALVPSVSDGNNPIVLGDNCTYTQGYWKTHPEEWPVSSLVLGNIGYTQEELLDILDQPVMGNGLVSLAHQLIAVKLNIATGADSSDVDPEVTEADGLIGDLVIPPFGTGFLDPSVTEAYTSLFDRYNKGYIGPGHCGGGACCLPDAACGVLEEEECAKAGGIFFGAGAICDPDPCITPPSGACCLPTGECVLTTKLGCSESGGVYYGDGSTCELGLCDTPSSGACCLPTGECVVRTEVGCAESGGVYYGDGSTCDPGLCDTPPSGACCLANDVCIVLSREDCAARGGEYQGDDTSCDPNPCVTPTGACCLNPIGECEVMTMAACEAAGGTYVGDDIACNPGLCPPSATEPVTWGKLKNRMHP